MNKKEKDRELEKYYIFFDTIYKKPKKTLMAISWWSDSMYAAHIIQRYRRERKRDEKYLYYIYCDHNIREKNIDQKIIETIVDKEKLYVTTRKKNNSIDEESLRIRRYEEIRKYSIENKINILITGHNLSDRIESTFLHLLRGAQIDGFLNMKKNEKRSHMFNWSIIRPLLEDGKERIEEECMKNHIKYIKDETNDDIYFSKRNKIRKIILKKLKKWSHKYNNSNNSFEESMNNIYNRCESKVNNIKIDLKQIPRYKIRESERAYRWNIKQKDITTEKVKKALNILHIKNNITKKNIEEISNFLKEKNKWHKYINKHYRFISHGNIYIIKAKKDFWQESITEKPGNIQEIFTDTITPHDKNENRRFANDKDKIKWKSIKKWCINNKVPIFWRRNIIITESKKWSICVYIPKEMYN
jgi:tRNA(Ile)-lysidine synthetase-like protein